MSISTSSAIYNMHFNDGTVISMINLSQDRPTYIGEYELIIPNLYFGEEFGQYPTYYIKYDTLGNKYEFRDNNVIINDHSYNITYGRACFGYYPETNKVVLCNFQTGHTIPYIEKYIFCANGITLSRDTTGTPFNSFGEALNYGHEVFVNPPPTYNGWYKLENVVPRTRATPFYGTTVFCGETLTHDVAYSLFWHGLSTTYEIDLDVSSLLEDFDPTPDPIPDDDPFEPGGNSGGGGGTGNFDGTGDDISIPSLPTLSAVDAGFITLFNPSTAQLKNLASYMWSGFFDIETYKKIFADPMDCILGLSIVPVAVPNGGTKPVSVGNISTGISMTVASQQYVEVDCGTLNVNEYWGAYLDYDPFTKAEIYLPYIGIRALAVDDIMNKAVTVKYHVDILSGSCAAYVKCGGSVIYQFIGQCSSSIPICSNDWTNVINGCLSIAASIGKLAASGGASAPQDIPAMAATATNSLKPSIEKSAAMSGTGGMLAVQTPYLILTRPRQALPRSQNHFTGYPAFITEVLGSISGYTEVEEIHLTGVPATDEELKEIVELLEKGVIL